jgi:hypothetical protein
MGWLVNPDTLPVLITAIGIGVSLVWALVGKNRDAARESLLKQIDLLQNLLKTKDEEREAIRAKRMELEQMNARLEIRIAKLEAERAN